MTYPQQPYGGQDPYAGQSGYGGYGAPPPPPPKKNTAAVLAVVGVVVVVLAAVGITGFVAPGFFLSGDDTTTGGGPTTKPTSTSSSTKPDSGGAENALAAVVDGLDTQDTDALEEVACADADPIVAEAIGDAKNVTGAELTDTEEVADDEVLGTVEISVDDQSADFEVTVVEDGGTWCWQDIAATGSPTPSEPTASSGPATEPSAPGGAPTAGGQPVPAAALAVMQTFLDAVNAGDAAAAKGTLCGDAISSAEDVDELVGYDPDLAINPSTDGISGSGQSVQLYLRGTAKGQELEGYSANLWVTSYDGPWCVHAFRAVVI